MDEMQQARRAVWTAAGFVPDPTTLLGLTEPSIGVVVLALAQFMETAEAQAAGLRVQLNLVTLRLDALTEEFRVLQARERREHQPVAGRIKFVPGQAVRGVVSFTPPVDPQP